jgi:hypothetical protein
MPQTCSPSRRDLRGARPTFHPLEPAGFSATADIVLAPSVPVLFATYFQLLAGRNAPLRGTLAKSYADYKTCTGMFLPSPRSVHLRLDWR